MSISNAKQGSPVPPSASTGGARGTGDKWIVRDPAVGDEEFGTLECALKAAALSIEEYLDCEEWSPGVTDVHILHGSVMTHRAVEVPCDPPDDVLEAMEDDPDYRPPFDYYCNYEMRALQSRENPPRSESDAQGQPDFGTQGGQEL